MPATRAGWARAGQRAHHLLGRDVPIPLPSAEKSGGGRREPMRPRKPQAGHHRRQVLPGHRPMDQMAVPGNGRAEVDGQRGANHGQNLGGFSSTLKVEGGKKKNIHAHRNTKRGKEISPRTPGLCKHAGLRRCICRSPYAETWNGAHRYAPGKKRQPTLLECRSEVRAQAWAARPRAAQVLPRVQPQGRPLRRPTGCTCGYLPPGVL